MAPVEVFCFKAILIKRMAVEGNFSRLTQFLGRGGIPFLVNYMRTGESGT
jgi:hypothetical protein